MFLDQIGGSRGLDWIDVGCGTEALSEAILARCGPRSVAGIDPSAGFIAHAREIVRDPRAHFLIGDALTLPLNSGGGDVVVSALMLNSVPDRLKVLEEMKRVARRGGRVCFYVWCTAPGSWDT